MDGENKGKPYEQMDDLGGFYHPYFWFNTHVVVSGVFNCIGISNGDGFHILHLEK